MRGRGAGVDRGEGGGSKCLDWLIFWSVCSIPFLSLLYLLRHMEVLAVASGMHWHLYL